jgi:hypothetical protein
VVRGKTIYDRTQLDKSVLETWRHAIDAEDFLHRQWIMDPTTHFMFKPNLLGFVNTFKPLELSSSIVIAARITTHSSASAGADDAAHLFSRSDRDSQLETETRRYLNLDASELPHSAGGEFTTSQE